MSIGNGSSGHIEQAKRAVGSILNLLRFQPVDTLDEAKMRLRLLEEFALEAFLAISAVEDAEHPATEHPTTPRIPAIHVERAFPAAASNLVTSH